MNKIRTLLSCISTDTYEYQSTLTAENILKRLRKCTESGYQTPEYRTNLKGEVNDSGKFKLIRKQGTFHYKGGLQPVYLSGHISENTDNTCSVILILEGNKRGIFFSFLLGFLVFMGVFFSDKLSILESIMLFSLPTIAFLIPALDTIKSKKTLRLDFENALKLPHKTQPDIMNCIFFEVKN